MGLLEVLPDPAQSTKDPEMSNVKSVSAIPKHRAGTRPASGRRLSAGSAGVSSFCSTDGGDDRFAALSEVGCSGCPLE
eukprot:3040527-Alexandrium_andersonii.AAC.1